MAQVIADRRDVDFVLHEQLNAADLSKNEKFAEFNKKTIDMIVTEARSLAVKEFLPINKEGDEIGATFDGGKVAVPESFKKAYDLLREGEWTAMTEDPEYGGQGMPQVVSRAANDYFQGANYAFMLYAGLTHGAGRLVEVFGTQEQKETYLKKLYTGEWSGTMLLTEAEAGSDVGALTTTAVKNPDGTYSISGSKIFISGGEHDMTENIIHPVLARIEGAPPGTRGISLFLVPKYRVNADGSLGDFNDVVCTGIEEKMGIHGSSTCSLTLGGKGKCIGTLLGQENKGMSAMFVMMNEARLLVGMQAFGCATASYMSALNYAKERIQGRPLTAGKDASVGGVPIIRHPDVRRQLMNMKVMVEGMRSLHYYVGYCQDMAVLAGTEEEKEKYEGLVDILTPIAKGYGTDKAFEVCSHGVQVYGGYGYTKEYPVEQYLRDCRITMIYEGTNGIQAMDLFGRKMTMKKGKLVMDLFGEIMKTVNAAKAIDSLKDAAEKVEASLNKLGEAARHLGKTAMENVDLAFAYAYPLMEVTGDVVMGWMLLWRAVIAAQKLEAKPKDAAFYQGQIKSVEFFVNVFLPVALGKVNSMLATNGAAVEIEDASFGG
ncbi:acyl-CoA dehydrogenase [Desulfosudis oleivorans]|uniref:Acyl-CoA dehydrogenase domain protein n=1 Tax=Desulfosudis oleivorans (strain DSM 6200 / JCM 39069 / Hxd3) TaxID=96561 RepID=A8ZVI3_DESOH|nr:acyl-CoA dehydrogenase [Desulfosudis oleivorans]ABW68170.1 acyl-CoA dehydrogenase domain protein [Desulfosudis oleivorans Hxd3]